MSLQGGTPISFENGLLRGAVDTNYFQSDFIAFLNDLPEAVVERRFPILKEREDRLYLIAEIERGGTKESLFVKVDDFTRKVRFKKWIRNWFVRSRARKSWEAAHYFLEHGFPTPFPVAFFEKRRYGFLLQSYLVVRFIGSAEPLQKGYLSRDPGKNPSDIQGSAKRRGLIIRLASLLASIHERGVSYGDLKASNVLIVPEGEYERLFFIDLESVRLKKSSLAASARVDDLGSIFGSVLEILSMRDAIYFINHYLNASPGLHIDKRSLMSAIYRCAVERRKRGERRIGKERYGERGR